MNTVQKRLKESVDELTHDLKEKAPEAGPPVFGVVVVAVEKGKNARYGTQFVSIHGNHIEDKETILNTIGHSMNIATEIAVQTANGIREVSGVAPLTEEESAALEVVVRADILAAGRLKE